LNAIKKRSDEDKRVADYRTCINCSAIGKPLLADEEKGIDVYFCLECGHVWEYSPTEKIIMDIYGEELRKFYWRKTDQKPKNWQR
jgi:Zn ribbon nucleic-acid-binding protein